MAAKKFFTKKSSRKAVKNEKNIAQDHDEDFFTLADQDPAAQDEENFVAAATKISSQACSSYNEEIIEEVQS